LKKNEKKKYKKKHQKFNSMVQKIKRPFIALGDAIKQKFASKKVAVPIEVEMEILTDPKTTHTTSSRPGPTIIAASKARETQILRAPAGFESSKLYQQAMLRKEAQVSDGEEDDNDGWDD
jgi:hypothetical protein